MANVTVAYDEDCGACRWTAERLRRLDRAGHLAFVAIQDADDLLRDVPAARRLDAMHAVTADGRVHTGGAAIPVMVGELPAGAPVAWVASLWPAGTERIYRAAARRRTTIGRWLGQQACAVDPGRPRRIR
jgi:predicted DCC family thiol-disulfide oxidoreductase YuxK